MQTSDGINEAINALAKSRFIPWVMERVLDAVEASGKKRTGHAAAMYLNKKYGSQLMSQHTLNYMRGKTVPRGKQAVELIETAGLDPFTYLPFAEAESAFCDKRSSYNHKLILACNCDYWAAVMGIETPWVPDKDIANGIVGGYAGLAGMTVINVTQAEVDEINLGRKYA